MKYLLSSHFSLFENLLAAWKRVFTSIHVSVYIGICKTKSWLCGSNKIIDRITPNFKISFLTRFWTLHIKVTLFSFTHLLGDCKITPQILHFIEAHWTSTIRSANVALSVGWNPSILRTFYKGTLSQYTLLSYV